MPGRVATCSCAKQLPRNKDWRREWGLPFAANNLAYRKQRTKPGLFPVQPISIYMHVGIRMLVFAFIFLLALLVMLLSMRPEIVRRT